MKAATQGADAHAGASDHARADLLERRLNRFQPRFQPRVRALADSHPRLKDLAASFPALLFALAVPRAGCDVARAVDRVIGGAALRELAVMTSLPFWLKRLDAAAFVGPIPRLPDGPFVSRQIVNYIPQAPAKVQSWLDAISRAYAVADESVAMWMAREWVNIPRRRRPDPVPWPLLWSWYARHVPDDPCRIRQTWKPSLSLESVGRFAREWRRNVMFFVEFGDDVIADMWLEPELSATSLSSRCEPTRTSQVRRLQ